MIYDLIVVGMGPAGVSAAIYAKRAGLKILCLEKAMIGGYLNFIDQVDNYPGLFGISGPDFAFSLLETVNKLEIELKNQNVISIVDGEIKKVITDKDEYLCNYLIIATGREPRKIGLENEKDLYGKGLSHCALCDGAFHKNKDVAVLGGGASALQEALYLSNICNKVYVIHRKHKFSVIGDLSDRVNQKDNIEKIMNARILKLNTENDKVASILLDNGRTIDVSCLFSYIGFVPGTDFANALNITNEEGYIIVDENYETKVAGIYAIGDIIKKDIYQISTGVNDGVVAATKIIDKINK